MKNSDIFIAMIEEEINQYNHLYLYKEKKWAENKEYKKLAQYSLKQTLFLRISAILFILSLSLMSVYHFVQFGSNGEWVPLLLGLISWGLVIYVTFFYSRDILQKKLTMERVLKLLDAREEYYQNQN
tara:strand:+ start:992 stop:1372 length:381 start_codon:yes stop_codon:yes gene_type:complete